MKRNKQYHSSRLLKVKFLLCKGYINKLVQVKYSHHQK